MVVSNFDAAFRVVAANLAVGVLPLQLGRQHAQPRGIGMVPLADPWAKRRFVVCLRDYDVLASAAQNMVDHLGKSAEA